MPKKYKPVVLAEEETLTNEDFLAAVKKVMEHLDKRHGENRKQLEEVAAKVFNDFTSKSSEIDGSLQKNINTLTKNIAAIEEELRGRGTELDAKITARLAQLKDGKSPEMTAILEAMKPYIPLPVPGSPDNAEDVRNKLELLEGDERLKIEAIKDLREELDKMWKEHKSRSSFLGGGGSMRVQQTILAPAESVDDSTTTYTFGQKPLIVVVNGANYREGHGWTWVNEQVVLDNIVGASGDLYGII